MNNIERMIETKELLTQTEFSEISGISIVRLNQLRNGYSATNSYKKKYIFPPLLNENEHFIYYKTKVLFVKSKLEEILRLKNNKNKHEFVK